VPAVTTGAAYGNTFLAALGIGLVDSYAAVSNWLRDDVTIMPDAAKAELYERYYGIYLDLYHQNKRLMHALHDLA
jgi:xylulokinase